MSDIKEIKCPIFALFGDKDKQVPPIEDYNLIKTNLPPNASSMVLLIPNMNHFMQQDTTGEPGNYSKIETTIMPEILSQLGSWINRLPY